MRLTTNVNGEDERDLNAAVEMALVEAQNALRFFQLEWIAVDDEHAERVLADERLARDRHYLASARRFAPHTRSEPEEEMLAERDPAAGGAWHTLFDQVTSTLRVPFDGEDRTIDEVLARVRGPVRETRLAAYEALFTALEPETRRARARATTRWSPIVSCSIACAGTSTRAKRATSTTSCRARPWTSCSRPSSAHHDLAHRWFRHKAKLLGLEKLALGDQYAPLGSTRAGRLRRRHVARRRARWTTSRRASARSRTVSIGSNRIDAEPRSGKRGGAFCASIAQDALPYIMLNFTDQMDDVRTLAHEIGHAMQFQSAGERQTALSHHPPLALAEVPSTFAEMIVDRSPAGGRRRPRRAARPARGAASRRRSRPCSARR